MKIVKKIVIVFCLFTFWAVATNAHPFYVSICQVDFNKENQSLEISVKIFANDLLVALEKTGATKIFLGETKENPETDKFIFNYLKSELKFKVNGKNVNYSFVGKEMETDVVWSYLEINGISELNEIEVECDLLTEEFNSQSNIIQINNGEGIKNLLLSKQKTMGSITY